MSNKSFQETPSKIQQLDNSLVYNVSINYSINDTPSFIDDSNSDTSSSDEMEIVITESPKRKKEIDLEDKKVLENIEEEIDKQLDEKAAKSNLTATNVKNILKHVISNEHVLAMVRHTVEEGDSTDEESFVYEPKLTRAKAKELYEKNVINPWVKPLPKPASEVNVLINEDLPEDSDDDEYLPNELEESEDDRDRSDLDSQPSTPQTPLNQSDCATQTNWSEDGMFKIPETPSKDKETENIALRTRSKLSLSDTPLEKIEEAFIPPDITTDMYDLECDDEDWKDFLNKFTKPLDEVVQGQPEDDDDPEYNVLADEDVEIVDHEELHEELREDRAVKVTKKELNDLVAELFDYNDLFLMNDSNIANESNLNESTIQVEKETETSVTDKIDIEKPGVENVAPFMTYQQEQLLQQQLRQHVQLTTQHFLQTYQHPEYKHMAKTFKEFLVAFHELGKYKTVSSFHIINLNPALELVENWEKQYESKDPEFMKMQEFIIEDINRIKKTKHFRGKKTNFLAKHADHFLQTISNSCAFLYPELLPTVPFRLDIDPIKQFYIPSENELIALGLEQFQTYVQEEDKAHLTKFGKVRWADAAYFISKYIMPHKDVTKLYRHIKGSNEKSAPMNPIKYYVQNNRAPPITHNITTLEALSVVPPCERNLDDLPYVWQKFIQTKKKEKEEKIVTETKKKSKESKTKVQNKKKTKKIPDLSEHYLIQDVDNPRLFNLVPIESYNKSRNKISEPDIFIESNNNNKRKRSNEDINVNNKHTKTVDSNISNKTYNNISSIVKYDSCDDIDIEETDLSSIKQENEERLNNPVLNNLCNIASRHRDRLSELIKIVNIFLKKDFLSTPLRNVKFNSSIFKNIFKNKLQSPEIKRLRVSDNMLPSMPFLLTPIKSQVQEDIESPEKEKDKDLEKDKTDEVENIEVNDSPEEVTTDRKDDEDELHALMIASSTIQKSKKLPPTNSEKRKSKIQREYNATLAMLSPENPNTEEEKANNFAQAYFDKVHERLENENPCTYQKFMEILSEYDSSKSICELWEKIESVLANHPDLSEEFLTFLTPVQAKQIGKLVPHFLLSNMSLFLRKLEIYFNNQPAQLRKIYNSLTELANIPDVKIEQVKGTILPLLKGNVLLIDWFLQMFPSETPPESMLNVWETVQCDEENFDSDNEPFETITLPETDDPYGGPNCICDCHKKDDEMYTSRARHCIPCGTKFIQGRVYVQTGKGLRLANVTFNNSPDTDHNKRLSAKPTQRHKRKSETSPSKTPISPTKEDEPRHSTESEDDINLETNKTSKKTFKNTSPRPKKRNRPTPRTRKLKTPKETINRRIIKSKVKKTDTSEPVISDLSKETTSETEIIENENLTSKVELESETEIADYEVKSPERSTESADTCEESSQDTIGQQNSDSDISIAEIESVSENSDDSSQENNDDSSWTRQEDKVILQMFKEYGDGEHIYKNIQQVLSNRTVTDIRQRFRLLLSLLQEMSHV